MKFYSRHTIFLFLFLMMSSCNDSENRIGNRPLNQNELSEQLKYSIDTTGISILWTAYKFSNKTGVSGTFSNYTFENKKAIGTVENILNKSKLSIFTSTVNSGNPIRDFKLDTYFFKAFSPSEIKGTITEVKKDEGIINLKMNHTSKKIPFTYSIKKDTIRLFTNLNLNYWKAEEALKTLNKECYELHKGTNGISKLWPDVDVVIKIPMHKILTID